MPGRIAVTGVLLEAQAALPLAGEKRRTALHLVCATPVI